MTDLFLSMKNISKRYTGVQALDQVDFEIARGEIHCLVGENGSGKSTLIKIISGVVKPDSGARIEVEGDVILHHHSIDSILKGIEVIYQDLSLFPNLTVAENISLSQTIASRSKIINWRRVREISEKAMARIGVLISLDEQIDNLSIADQQLVAICRALTSEVKLLILDEPTSALTRKEVESLFTVIKDLQVKGIATLFVSHKLDEVLQIAEKVTILRDGKKIETLPSRVLTDEKLTFLMTGEKLEYRRYTIDNRHEEPIFEARKLSIQGNFRDISFKLYPGDILGITGLLGSGRTELAEALFGMNPVESGDLFVQGSKTSIKSVQEAIKLGIGYVPENRLVQGLVMNQSVAKNIIITTITKLLNKFKLIDPGKRQMSITRWIKDLSIKIPASDAPVHTLSGGNQQRVVLAKWIATSPKVLILDGPTVGIDVAAKSSIHDIIRDLAGRGVGIIIISDEVPEVFHNCNRVMVMHKGRIIAEFDSKLTTEEEIQNCINMAS